jgi:hypothetical protein
MAEISYCRNETLEKDLPELMKWLERRVKHHKGAHPLEMVFLSLLGAELCVSSVVKTWPYDEDCGELIERMRAEAKELIVDVRASIKS